MTFSTIPVSSVSWQYISTVLYTKLCCIAWVSHHREDPKGLPSRNNTARDCYAIRLCCTRIRPRKRSCRDQWSTHWATQRSPRIAKCAKPVKCASALFSLTSRYCRIVVHMQHLQYSTSSYVGNSSCTAHQSLNGIQYTGSAKNGTTYHDHRVLGLASYYLRLLGRCYNTVLRGSIMQSTE